jgi:AcrR family transcriptional regulator
MAESSAPAAGRTKPASAGKAAAPARSGRRRGPTTTRAAVLAAARQAFEEHGYAATSMREVARRAGVDASLIVHFYGSKAGLLAEVVRWPFDLEHAVDQITAEGPEHIGRRLAAMFINSWESGEGGPSVLVLLHAGVADPKAAALLREFLKVRMIEPILDYLDADRPDLRATLIAGQVFGFGITHYLLELDDMTATPDQLTEVLGHSLQRLAAEPL